MRKLVIGALAALGIFATTDARAQTAASAASAASAPSAPETGAATEPAFEANHATGRVGGDLYWWSVKRLGSTFALVPYLQLPITESVFLDVDLPLAANLSSNDDKMRFAIGNPTIGAHYAKAASPTVTWYIGGRANVPVLTLTDDTTMQIVGLLGAYTTALYNLHRYIPNYLPVSAFGGVEGALGKGLVLRADLAPGVLIPLKSRSGFLSTNDKTNVYYQLRGEAEFRSLSGVGGGLAFTVVHVLNSDADDAAQGAIDLFAAYTTPSAFLGRLGMLFAVDKPLGGGFDTGKVLTFYVSAGTRF